MFRWIATVLIGLLFVLNGMLPGTDIGRRGNEAAARSEVDGVASAVGTQLADFDLRDIEGEPVRLASLRGHRVLLTFERSVDW
jgi:cytochrome oxidase Cu insertion factor (SCO1/SenC/PrrC family)